MEKMPIKEDNVVISRTEYELMKSQIQYLMEQLKLSKHRQFGASSEKSQYDWDGEYDQINLFNEAEVYAEPLAAEPALTEVEKHYRKKRREAKDRLPVETIEHKLSDNEQDCPACDGKLHVMGKEVVRRDLKLIPAKAVIVEHVRYTYACRNCEQNAINVPIVKAPMPQPVIRPC